MGVGLVVGVDTGAGAGAGAGARVCVSAGAHEGVPGTCAVVVLTCGFSRSTAPGAVGALPGRRCHHSQL